MRQTSLKTVASRLFAECSQPVYILDGSYRITFANEALARWMECDLDALINKRCDYQATHSHSENRHNQLAPPPQAWATPQLAGEISVTGDKGHQRRRAWFLRIANAYAGQQPAMLVVLDEEDHQQAQDRHPLDSQLLHDELMRLSAESLDLPKLTSLVGSSPAIRQANRQIEIAISYPSRTVIVGPSGSGRETIARAIHRARDPESAGSLIPFSCDVLDAELLESSIEAIVRQSAELSEAELGTLLLLDVDQLSTESQAALLGFMEIPELNLQTIATSTVPLLKLADQQTFRPELAHDLTLLEIGIPPLAERTQDIPLIAQALVEASNVTQTKQLAGFTAAAMIRLNGYAWPGNFSEIRKFVTEAIEVAAGPMIQETDLPDRIRLAEEAAEHPRIAAETIQLDSFLADIERELIQRALRKAKGNKAEAARSLGISRAKLLRRIQQLHVELRIE